MGFAVLKLTKTGIAWMGTDSQFTGSRFMFTASLRFAVLCVSG